MGAYAAAVWRCRYFWLALVRMDLATRYRRSLLGLGWSLLNPIVLTVIVYSVFQPVLAGGARNYALEVLTGLVVWGYVTYATSQGCQCFLLAETYIRQYPTPLAVFPLRTALGGLVHFGLALIVVLAAGLLTVGLHGIPLLLGLPAALMLLFGLGWCLALLAGFANVMFRDTEHLVQVAFQVLFYVTPIIYPAQMLDGYRLGWLLKLNPLVPFLRLFRDPILQGILPPWTTYAAASSTVLVLALFTVGVLHRLQRRLIFYL